MVKAIGYDFDRLQAGADDMMNKPLLLEGRVPRSSDECVVEATEELLGVTFQVGANIVLTSGKTDADLSETLVTNRFTIVGIVQSLSLIHISHSFSFVSFEGCAAATEDGDFRGNPSSNIVDGEIRPKLKNIYILHCLPICILSDIWLLFRWKIKALIENFLDK